MNLKKFKITNRGLYWGLIFTFIALYACVGFVSTLHSITFFNLANNMGLAILLGITYEIGQASVLFSILMTKNKDRFLPWALMILLTALQVTANVYASFKYMVGTGSDDWTFWQKSILFGVQASSPEMYQVIISWISGALLPIVALGMTALVAENIKLMTEGDKIEPDPETKEPIEKDIESKPEEINTFKLEDYNSKPVYPSAKEQKELFIDREIDTFDENNLDDDKFVEDYNIAMDQMYNQEITDINRFVEHSKSKDDDKDPEQFEKDKLIVPDKPPKKKMGRPPKNKKTVVESKKEKEPLQNEEVKVPKKSKRIVNPLNKKTKIGKINLKELNKLSKGEEVIALLENAEKDKDKVTITQADKSDEISQQNILVPPELLTPYLNNGVEVLDAKAILKKPEVKKN